MIQVTTPRRASWIGIAWLLLGVMGLLVALALGNTIVWLALLAAVIVAGLLLVRGQAPNLVSAPPAVGATDRSRVQRGVLMGDGTLRQALVVPATATEGYQVVLTIDGYALINDEGRVVCALNRVAHTPTSEPVVATIMDAASVTR
jgi:hypothetical protein